MRRLRLEVLAREVVTSKNDDGWSSTESEPEEEEPKKRRLSEPNEDVVVDTREIMHYQFIAWHDYDTPDKLDTLLDFLLEVRVCCVNIQHTNTSTGTSQWATQYIQVRTASYSL